MVEQWKDIYFIENGIEYDYRGLYQVSNLGRVKSFHNGKEKILKSSKDKDGYLRLVLCKNGKKKYFRVYRLVAHMFVNGYFDGAEVDHINTIHSDNRAENLHWVTRKENCNNPITKENISQANKREKGKKVIQYDLDGNLIKIWDCIIQVEKELGIHHSNVIKCCKGKLKTIGGFIWKYANEN